jgi:hypothetical protein
LNDRSNSVDVPLHQPEPEPEPEPEPKKKTSAVAPPDGVTDSVWTDFCQHRKARGAKLTQTALDGIAAEAGKAGWALEDALRECCTRGWTGFKADWVADKLTATGNRVTQPTNKQEALETRNRALAEEMIAEFNAKNNAVGAEVEAV